MTEYGKTSKTMDALERLKSEMAKYGDIEPKERDEKATLDAQAKALLENAKRLIDALGLIAHNHIRYSSQNFYLLRALKP